METSKIVLGHRFVPFSDFDWETYAGASEGSLICHTGKNTLIYDPKIGIVSEMVENGQIDWTPERVVSYDEEI